MALKLFSCRCSSRCELRRKPKVTSRRRTTSHGKTLLLFRTQQAIEVPTEGTPKVPASGCDATVRNDAQLTMRSRSPALALGGRQLSPRLPTCLILGSVASAARCADGWWSSVRNHSPTGSRGATAARARPNSRWGSAVGDRPSDGRAVQVERHRADRGGPLDTGRQRHCRLAGGGCGHHVFERQLRRQRVEQLAIRKAPVRHNGDFHPGRQHLPQPAQHLVLIAPLVTLQRRGGHRLPRQGRRPPMASHHRQHDGVLPVGREARPIQRNDHLRAGADDERRPVCGNRPRRRRLDCSGADPPASHHAWSTHPGPGPSRAPLHGLPAKRSSARPGWRWPLTASVWRAGRLHTRW